MYIPTGKTGYFNIQGEVENGGGALNGQGSFNSPDLIFNNTVSGTGMVGVGGAYVNLGNASAEYSWNYPESTWFTIRIVFVISDDANSTGWTMTVNDVALEQQDFKVSGSPIIGEINFYSVNANNEYYIDDILFEEINPSNTENLILQKIKASPNPVTNMLTIGSPKETDEIIVYDIIGSPLLNVTPQVFSPSIDMSNFSSGMYLVEVRIGTFKRIIRVKK